MMPWLPHVAHIASGSPEEGDDGFLDVVLNFAALLLVILLVQGIERINVDQSQEPPLRQTGEMMRLSLEGEAAYDMDRKAWTLEEVVKAANEKRGESVIPRVHITLDPSVPTGQSWHWINTLIENDIEVVEAFKKREREYKKPKREEP